MARPSDILKQIQDALFSRGVNPRPNDDFIDVPFLSYEQPDEEYEPYVRLEQEDTKDEEETASDEEARAEEPTPVEPVKTPIKPRMGMEPGMRMEPGMGISGMEEEEPKTPSEIGRIYELKKIYSRLVSIESFLSTTSDLTLLKLRDYISDAVSLFETLASNLGSFKDKLDKIIVLFYEFLDIVYMMVKEYYKIKSTENSDI